MAVQTTGLPALLTLGRVIIGRFISPRRPSGPDLAQIDQLARAIARYNTTRTVGSPVCLDLMPGMQDWLDAGVPVNEGDEITLFTAGDITASRLIDVRMGPKVVLWRRIGLDGPIRKFPNGSPSFRAERSGPLYLALYPPGDWQNEAGDFVPGKRWRGASGIVRVLIVKWTAGIEQGLTSLLPASKNGLVKTALMHWQYPVTQPQGWNYLWRLGAGEIYSAGAKRGHICCHTDRDVGILQIPAGFPLEDSTRLSWRWRADLLPSSIREDIQPTHDYLSIAVEFDNGLDLTYMWSCELPGDTIFQCPLPWWKERETHWVIRSDAADLGKWLTEERNISADYARAIGGEPPSRIVAVWLIANSVFQRGEGKCEYANIMLSGAGRQLALN